jgi:hypothetical protein
MSIPNQQNGHLNTNRWISPATIPWYLLIGLAMTGLVMCSHAYLYTSSTAVGLEWHWRGICIYSTIICFALLGVIRGMGPLVFFPLLASLISVTFVYSGVNAVAQLCFFVTVGLMIGLMVEFIDRRRRSP